MSKRAYDRLKQRVEDGAALYLSMDDGFLTEFEEFTGLQVVQSRRTACREELQLSDGKKICIERDYQFTLRPTRAEVLVRDGVGNPMLTRAKYGKGLVMVANFPLEKMLIDTPDSAEGPYFHVYSCLLDEQLKRLDVRCANPHIGATVHGEGEERTVVLVNYSAEAQDAYLRLNPRAEIAAVLYGDAEKIRPCDAAIFRIRVRG